MNFTDMKVEGTNVININDAFNSLVLQLKIKPNENTTIPTNNELIIYVDKSEVTSQDRKQIVFELSDSLKYLNNSDLSSTDNDPQADEFIIEPKMVGNTVKMIAYVKRVVNGDEILTPASTEELDYQEITLFEGVNYIYTNYNNATIEMLYPKNSDAVKYFLNTAVFDYYVRNSQTAIEDTDFKDAFTATDDGFDVKANNVNINCLTSRNNKFSLDSDGNLFVNSLTTVVSTPTTTNFDAIYPVGSIYLNTTNVNPTTLFGGTWEQIKDRFLLACGSTYTNGATGGEATHKLTINEMPSHKHNTQGQWQTAGSGNRCLSYNKISGDPVRTDNPILATGGNQAHNNMPPYLAVYVWKRTA